MSKQSRVLAVRYPVGKTPNQVPTTHLWGKDGPICGNRAVKPGQNGWELVESTQVENWGRRLCVYCREELDEELRGVLVPVFAARGPR
ncbi:hypothetical protein [Candidatus Chloroploca asiatica]|uniref:hypothetical protein n=1 Tax=Candidatus Chloroploca asiatica TaxID=1506545 RepID=UPI00114201FA|nr:hypothetical protein [Candidatus Chloroploca asiatica]